MRPQCGPDRTRVKSSTRMSVSGRGAVTVSIVADRATSLAASVTLNG